jgi:hypothetical protein
MYGKGPVVISTWAYAIAHTKPDGLVELNALLLAATLGCKPGEVEAAIEFLCSPDSKSRTKTDEGKRLIREGEYLYRTVNHSLYNSVRNEPERREYNRIKKQESRARQSASIHPVKHGQTCQPMQTHTADADADADSEKNTTAAARPTNSETPPEFVEFQRIYPKRSGGNPWPRTLKAIHARLREGHSWDEIMAGASRYHEFIRATGKDRTEFVMQAATFCGPDKRFLEPWDMPPSKAQLRQDKAVGVARDWLALKGEADAGR